MRPFALLLLLGSCASPAPAQDRPPNIVFILADDLGYAELGCYGQKKIRTPSIDRLAAEGMRFTQVYSGNAVCAPSRCALMTGMHMGHAAVRNNSEVKPEGQKPIPDAAVTVAELLKAKGYATGAIGKWGLGPPESTGDPLKQGFDFFFGYNCQRHAHSHTPTFLYRNHEKVMLEGNTGATGRQHSQDHFETEALKFVRENKDRPFFLYLPFTIPHLALQVPDDALAEYKGLWDDPPYDGGKGYLPHPTPRACYAAMITRMDRSVGRLMDLLKSLSLDANTLVCFSSDNGPTHSAGVDAAFFGSAGPLRGLKGSLHEGGIRVPFLARWPGRIKAGTVNDHVAYFPDMLPTLCEAAGADVPKGIDGLGFLPALLGKEQKKHESLYWEFAGYGGWQALRAGDWKIVRQDLNKGNLGFQLYNLAADAGEKDDLAAKHPELVQRLARLAAESRAPSPEFALKALDAGK